MAEKNVALQEKTDNIPATHDIQGFKPDLFDYENEAGYMISKIKMMEGLLGSFERPDDRIVLKGDAIAGLKRTFRDVGELVDKLLLCTSYYDLKSRAE